MAVLLYDCTDFACVGLFKQASELRAFIFSCKEHSTCSGRSISSVLHPDVCKLSETVITDKPRSHYPSHTIVYPGKQSAILKADFP